MILALNGIRNGCHNAHPSNNSYDFAQFALCLRIVRQFSRIYLVLKRFSNFLHKFSY